MGIGEFFKTLNNNDITKGAIQTNYKDKIENMKYLLVDFNSIIHNSSEKVTDDINKFFKLILQYLYEKQQSNYIINNETIKKYMKTYNMNNLKNNLGSINTFINFFHNYFNDNVINKLIIVDVIKYIMVVLNNYCEDRSIITLLLAIDGVPSKSKLLEQKQRQYIGYIETLYKNYLLYANRNSLQDDPNYIYWAIKYEIKWSKNNIKPGTIFMDKLIRYLKSDEIQKKIKCHEIIISDMYQIGEGEKKIINFIKEKLKVMLDKIVIFSPDADMILLSILLPVENIYILKYNKESNKNSSSYDLINISILKTKICDYVKQLTEKDVDSKKVNYDFVCISSLFGNDFIPKMETIHVYKDFISILTKYSQTIRDKNEYLVEITENQFKLNFNFLQHFLNNMIIIEDTYRKIISNPPEQRPENLNYFGQIYTLHYLKFPFDKTFNTQSIQLKTDNNINNYYNTYFNVKKLLENNKLTDTAESIMKIYLESLIWVFNYYFNDTSYINYWYYIYSKAPLLKHLYMYCDTINQNTLDIILKDLSKYQVSDVNSYFNPLEQLIYISPFNYSTLKILPCNYQKYLLNNKDHLPKNIHINIDEIFENNIMNGNTDNIDCHGIRFFDKCNVIMDKPTQEDDEKFLTFIRSENLQKNELSKILTQNKKPPF